MSLTRAAVCAKHLNFGTIAWQQRLSSSGGQAREEHDGRPESGFFTPFWRNALLLSLAAVGFYRWAPTPSQDAYLTKWLAEYATPRESWAAVNERQLLRSQQMTTSTVLQSVAQRPCKIRYRYPQVLEQGSPHLQPVGGVPY